MRAGGLLAMIAAGALAVLLAIAVPSSGQIPVPGDTTSDTSTTTTPATTTPASTATTSTTTTPAVTTPARPVNVHPLDLGNILALGIGTPISALAPFAPGRKATGSGVLAVTSLSAWTLTISDASGDGHLQRSAGCSTGVDELAQPLSVAASPLIGTSAGATSLSPTPTPVASGSVTTTITTNVSQAIGSAEILAAGCAYSATVTFTLG